MNLTFFSHAFSVGTFRHPCDDVVEFSRWHIVFNSACNLGQHAMWHLGAVKFRTNLCTKLTGMQNSSDIIVEECVHLFLLGLLPFHHALGASFLS